MGLRGRTVQRQRDGLGPGLVQLDEAGAGEPGGDRRGQGDAQADPGSVCDELGQVGPLERVAPGHDHQRARRPERCEVVPELPALVVVSSKGLRVRIASARQCVHASWHARVTSQITMKGRSAASWCMSRTGRLG